MTFLFFEVGRSRCPFARVLAMLANSWMDRAGIKSFALTMVYFGDCILESYSYSEALVFGEADGPVFSESIFDFRVR